MRIYVSDGKVYAAFEEDDTVEIGTVNVFSTLSVYKKSLLETVANIFDGIVMNAALKGLIETEKLKDKSEAKQQKTVSEPQESGTNQPRELFRAPKDGTARPEVKKTRQRIDYGKIMALHNAGWSNAKIADEMGMTYAAVATAISTYKKKMRLGGGKA